MSMYSLMRQMTPNLRQSRLEAVQTRLFLASADRRSEDVFVEAIIVPELGLCNVEWHVFAADLVERADDPALENRPEALLLIIAGRAAALLRPPKL